MMRRLLLAAVLFGLCGTGRAAVYRIDPGYSAVRLSVRHLLFFHRTAEFDKVEGTFDYEAGKPEVWKASATVSAASINAASAKKDKRFQSPRYLDAAHYPQISFVSTKAYRAKDGRVKLAGDLTIKGKTHPVELDVEASNPLTPTMDGRVGLTAHGFVDRSLWGIAGGLFTGWRVEVTAVLQGTPAD